MNERVTNNTHIDKQIDRDTYNYMNLETEFTEKFFEETRELDKIDPRLKLEELKQKLFEYKRNKLMEMLSILEIENYKSWPVVLTFGKNEDNKFIETGKFIVFLTNDKLFKLMTNPDNDPSELFVTVGTKGEVWSETNSFDKETLINLILQQTENFTISQYSFGNQNTEDQIYLG